MKSISRGQLFSQDLFASLVRCYGKKVLVDLLQGIELVRVGFHRHRNGLALAGLNRSKMPVKLSLRISGFSRGFDLAQEGHDFRTSDNDEFVRHGVPLFVVLWTTRT